MLGVHNGINIYSWDWNETARAMGIDEPTVGVLAQEHPEHAILVSEGFLKVDYASLFGDN